MRYPCMGTALGISNRIIEAVMAQKLARGARLGEQQLAMLFDCSRTIVREALTHLAARSAKRNAACIQNIKYKSNGKPGPRLAPLSE